MTTAAVCWRGDGSIELSGLAWPDPSIHPSTHAPYLLQGLKALMNNEENTLDLLLDEDLLFANNPIYKKEEL